MPGTPSVNFDEFVEAINHFTEPVNQQETESNELSELSLTALNKNFQNIFTNSVYTIEAPAVLDERNIPALIQCLQNIERCAQHMRETGVEKPIVIFLNNTNQTGAGVFAQQPEWALAIYLPANYSLRNDKQITHPDNQSQWLFIDLFTNNHFTKLRKYIREGFRAVSIDNDNRREINIPSCFPEASFVNVSHHSFPLMTQIISPNAAAYWLFYTAAICILKGNADFLPMVFADDYHIPAQMEKYLKTMQHHLWRDALILELENIQSQNPDEAREILAKMLILYKKKLLIDNVNLKITAEFSTLNLTELLAELERYQQLKRQIYELDSSDNFLKTFLTSQSIPVLQQWLNEAKKPDAQGLIAILDILIGNFSKTLQGFEDELQEYIDTKNTWTDWLTHQARRCSSLFAESSMILPLGKLAESATSIAQKTTPWIKRFYMQMVYMQTGGSPDAVDKISDAFDKMTSQQLARYAGHGIGLAILYSTGNKYSLAKSFAVYAATQNYRSYSASTPNDETATTQQKTVAPLSPLLFHHTLNLLMTTAEATYSQEPQLLVIFAASLFVSWLTQKGYDYFAAKPITEQEKLKHQNILFILSLLSQKLSQQALGTTAYYLNRRYLCDHAAEYFGKVLQEGEEVVSASCEAPTFWGLWKSKPVRANVFVVKKEKNPITADHSFLPVDALALPSSQKTGIESFTLYRCEVSVLNPNSFFADSGSFSCREAELQKLLTTGASPAPRYL